MNAENNTGKNEKDLLDLLTIIGGWISRFLHAMGRALLSLLSLTVRHWAIVMLPALLCMGLAIYINRPGKRYYKAQAIVRLGIAPADHDVAADVYRSLSEAWNVREDIPNSLANVLSLSTEDALALRKLTTYDVIANQIDASWVDYNGYSKSVPEEDTCTVLVKGKLALSFETRKPEHAALIGEAIVQYMNKHPQMQLKHRTFCKQIQDELTFLEQQTALLDSVSRAFYEAQINATPTYSQQGTNIVVGHQEIKLMTEQINEIIRRKGFLESQLSQFEAPVVQESAFVVSALPVRHPIFFPIKAFLAGWLLGLVLALCIENRKRWWSTLKVKG